jgi:hypothetical protein
MAKAEAAKASSAENGDANLMSCPKTQSRTNPILATVRPRTVWLLMLFSPQATRFLVERTTAVTKPRTRDVDFRTCVIGGCG